MKQLQQKILYGFFFLFFISSMNAQDRPIRQTNGRSFEHTPRPPLQDRGNNDDSTCPPTRFRTIDGTCNNVSRTDRVEWGASDIQLWRSMKSEYGQSDFWNTMGGENRPSARAVSNALCSQSEEVQSARGLSSFVFTWGQFLDHDIDLTPEDHIEYEPIVIPENESLFTEAIPFFRSAIHEGTGIDDARQQSNIITSWIDASNVYGSDEDRASWLRSFVDGKLKNSSGNLLPFNTIDGNYESELDPDAPSMAGDNGGTAVTFVAGDVRAAEQPGLTSLHTLFMRYHNRICDQLKAQGLRNDEEIYQRARKEVGATIQSITYNEFLPALGIDLRDARGYRPEVWPDISNLFASAAYRFGHSMVTDELLLKSDDCNDVAEGTVSLLEGFFNVEILREHNIAPILNGLAMQTQNEIDPMIIDNLRNFLFGDPTAEVVFGLDLASLNIQRGRDHGLPDYNAVRQHYTGQVARDFGDITRDQGVQQAFANTYGDVNDIDLWVGLLAEDKLRGSSVGRTMHEILKTQFEKLRDGDRFFFMHDPGLSRRDRDRIRRTQLSEVIRMCTETEHIQRNVFFAEDCDRSNLAQDGAQLRSELQLVGELNLLLYPNPAHQFINIEIEGFGDAVTKLTIFDPTGRVVREVPVSQSQTQLSIGDLSPGLYTIRLLHGDIIKVKRFLKVEL